MQSAFQSQRAQARLVRAAIYFFSSAALFSALLASPASASTTVAKPEQISAEALREDLAQLYTTLQAAHYDLYARRSKAEYDAFYQSTHRAITSASSRVEAAKRLQRFTAFGRIAHANVSAPFELFGPYREAGGKYLPLFVQIDQGRVYLSDTADAGGLLRAGTELLSIEGKPVAHWLARFAPLISADNEALSHAQMAQRFPILIWLELGEVTAVSVTARTATGETLKANLTAVTRAEYRAIAKQFPTAELNIDFNAREVRLLPDGIAYLRPGPFIDMEAAAGDTGVDYVDTQYRQFLDDAFHKILAHQTQDLLIDLRNNPGGDNSFSDPMVAWFADKPFHFTSRFMLKASAATKAHYTLLKANGVKEEGIIGKLMRDEAKSPDGTRYPFAIPLVAPREQPRFMGKVFVLQNRHSYSNATSVAALIQDYGFGKIMGEATADLVTTYGSSVPFKLRHTGFNVSFPKSYIVRINGDETPRGVVPDITLPGHTIGNSQDVVLEAALSAMQAARKSR